jgi:hypothetical protein
MLPGKNVCTHWNTAVDCKHKFWRDTVDSGLRVSGNKKTPENLRVIPTHELILLSLTSSSHETDFNF